MNEELTQVELIKIQAEAIRSIGASRGAMHRALVLTLIHVLKHGDWRNMAKFDLLIAQDEHSKSIHKRVRQWLQDYGGAIVSTDRTNMETFGKIVSIRGKDYIEERLELAKASPYYSMIKPKDEKPFDAEAKVVSLIKAFEKAKAECGKVWIKPSLLASLIVSIGLSLQDIEAALNDERLKESLGLGDDEGVEIAA